MRVVELKSVAKTFCFVFFVSRTSFFSSKTNLSHTNCVTPVWVKSHKKVTFCQPPVLFKSQEIIKKISSFAHVVGISLKCVKIKWTTIVSSNFFQSKNQLWLQLNIMFLLLTSLFSKKWQTKKTFKFRFHSLGSLFLADGNHAYTDSYIHLPRFCASHTHMCLPQGGGWGGMKVLTGRRFVRHAGRETSLHTLLDVRIWRRGM